MRLIDADAYKKLHQSKCVGDCGCCSSITDDMICTLIDEAPTVKEAIVPLKCKYCGYSYQKNPPAGEPLFRWCRKWQNIVRDTDFCSYAGKRGEVNV